MTDYVEEARTRLLSTGLINADLKDVFVVFQYDELKLLEKLLVALATNGNQVPKNRRQKLVYVIERGSPWALILGTIALVLERVW